MNTLLSFEIIVTPMIYTAFVCSVIMFVGLLWLLQDIRQYNRKMQQNDK